MTDFYSLPAHEQSTRLTQVAKEALTEWGVADCEPELLKYRENAVFKVRIADGRPAALRVHRQGYHSNESLRSELQWMSMLASAGITVPQPIPAQSGSSLIERRSDVAPGTWQIDLLSWLDGRMLGEVGEPLDLEGRDVATLFRELGRIMANLHSLSNSWSGNATMVRHAWDSNGLVGNDPLWGRFWELAALTADQKVFFQDVRTAMAEDLLDYGQAADNYGMIHADLVPENVFLSGNEVQLIDFDDAGFGWHMFEIVTALYWLTEEPAFDTIRTSVLDGYAEIRPLSSRDRGMEALFFAARSTTYMGWAHTRQNTETAMELTPFIIDLAERHCANYLKARVPAVRSAP